MREPTAPLDAWQGEPVGFLARLVNHDREETRPR